MGKKEFWNNVILSMGAQIFIAILVYITWGAAKYVPGMILLFSLGVYFIVGRVSKKLDNAYLRTLAILVPHIIGIAIYFFGKTIGVTGKLIKVFRLGFPQTYNTADLMAAWGADSLGRSSLIIIAAILIAILTVVQFNLGSRFANKRSSISATYNNIMVILTANYILAFFATQCINWNNKIMVPSKAHSVFATVMGIVIVATYMFIGRYSRKTEQSKVWHMISLGTPVLISAIMYGLVKLGVYQALRYEIFIMPTANSIFGDLAKKIGIMLGNGAEYISQYGLIASILIWIIPTVWMIIGSSVGKEDLK